MPSSPDDDREHLFVDLAERDPELADKLVRRFLDAWLRKARLTPATFEDAIASVELKVGPDEYGEEALRLRSFHTGTTSWLYEWDGSEAIATQFIDDEADSQALNVEQDRRHGYTPWEADQRQ